MNPNYKRTTYACFIGYIVQAIVNNFVPLLFATGETFVHAAAVSDNAAHHDKFSYPAAHRHAVGGLYRQDRVSGIGDTRSYLLSGRTRLADGAARAAA